MLVMIKSAPGSYRMRRAMRIAADAGANVVLMQDAVYMAEWERVRNTSGEIFAMEEDLRMRGIGDIPSGIRKIDYDTLVDLMAAEDKVVGLF